MASRSHVEVNERRLRLIYDCLDNGNNKKAIQEADKVLKKQKDFQCAKVLKALAMLRLGRHDDSSAILQEVHAQHPHNEATLQAMSICYREVHKMELIADLYENAHKSRPDNEEILSALFMAHVRLGDYKKQQQTAMLLHKLRPQKNPYYFWAVMSIIMQAHSATDKKLATSMYLPLAERMTKKYVTEGKVEAEAEVLLYLMILEQMDRWEDAAQLLEGPLGEKFVSELNFRATKLAELYRKLEKWPKANAEYRQLLVQNPDQWQFWSVYIDTVFHLVDCQWVPEEGDQSAEIDYSVEKALSFITEQIKGCENGRLFRGPYLARLELIRLLQTRGEESVSIVGCPLTLLKQYFDKYSDRSTYFGDMKLFVRILSVKEKEELLVYMTESLKLNKPGEPTIYAQDIKHMQRHISVLQLSRYIGQHRAMTDSDKVTLAKDLLDRHKKGLEFGTELLPTDLQYSDNYLILAAHLLLDAWRQSGKQLYVWQVVTQLELGMRKSPSNFQIKLLLVRLYCIMGAFGPCPALYDGMEIKHIMNDTLGHIVSSHVGRLGHFVAACAMYGTMLRFFTVNHKETTEYLISSYKYGSFGKIREFVNFREKLQNSLQYASATSERLLLDLTLETASHNSTEQMITYMEIDPEKDKTDINQLCDNRDFQVMSCWEPAELFDLETLQRQSFEEEKAWLRLRNLMLRLLAAAVMLGRQPDVNHHTNNGVSEERKPMSEVIQDLLQKLTSHLEDCDKFANSMLCQVDGPYRTRLSTFLSSGHHKVFKEMVQCVLYSNSLQDKGVGKSEENEEKRFTTVVPELLQEAVSQHKCPLINSPEGGAALNTEVLENLVLCAETLSYATILAGVCNRILKPLKSSWTKKLRKKKDTAPTQPCTFSNFNAMVDGLEKGASDLHQAVKEVDPVFLSLSLGTLNLSGPLTDSQEEMEIEKEVWLKVESSYQQSSRAVHDHVHLKLQYLHTLKL
ncbi:N-alpha-acetyltransferase 25, NatB auxiliary subunit-like [Haliotis rufescens]|uniref:N-alpha-acetyltransferase 25, NatB auxiliary subunit-like n=1 Tax=Haliotis rufescens TaxID=6454 RepID=UPI00201FAC56|nr:N-alpha-acetyltransferase 25, NatB auxiliary subunit-like [Haliotis rufescens]